MAPVGSTVNAALSMVITPLGCGSSAAPVMSIVACVVPRTLVRAVVIPCTSAELDRRAADVQIERVLLRGRSLLDALRASRLS